MTELEIVQQLFFGLMGSNNCFWAAIVDAFAPWHNVNTHLKGADQKSARIVAFTELVIILQPLKLIDAEVLSFFFSSHDVYGVSLATVK